MNSDGQYYVVDDQAIQNTKNTYTINSYAYDDVNNEYKATLNKENTIVNGYIFSEIPESTMNVKIIDEKVKPNQVDKIAEIEISWAKPEFNGVAGNYHYAIYSQLNYGEFKLLKDNINFNQTSYTYKEETSHGFEHKSLSYKIVLTNGDNEATLIYKKITRVDCYQKNTILSRKVFNSIDYNDITNTGEDISIRVVLEKDTVEDKNIDIDGLDLILVEKDGNELTDVATLQTKKGQLSYVFDFDKKPFPQRDLTYFVKLKVSKGKYVYSDKIYIKYIKTPIIEEVSNRKYDDKIVVKLRDINSFEGYNIYRNGKKLNSTILTKPEYIDTDPQEKNEYQVTGILKGIETEKSDVKVGSIINLDELSFNATKLEPLAKLSFKCIEGNFSEYKIQRYVVNDYLVRTLIGDPIIIPKDSTYKTDTYYRASEHKGVMTVEDYFPLVYNQDLGRNLSDGTKIYYEISLKLEIDDYNSKDYTSTIEDYSTIIGSPRRIKVSQDKQNIEVKFSSAPKEIRELPGFKYAIYEKKWENPKKYYWEKIAEVEDQVSSDDINKLDETYIVEDDNILDGKYHYYAVSYITKEYTNMDIATATSHDFRFSVLDIIRPFRIYLEESTKGLAFAPRECIADSVVDADGMYETFTQYKFKGDLLGKAESYTIKVYSKKEYEGSKDPIKVLLEKTIDAKKSNSEPSDKDGYINYDPATDVYTLNIKAPFANKFEITSDVKIIANNSKISSKEVAFTNNENARRRFTNDEIDQIYTVFAKRIDDIFYVIGSKLEDRWGRRVNGTSTSYLNCFVSTSDVASLLIDRDSFQSPGYITFSYKDPYKGFYLFTGEKDDIKRIYFSSRSNRELSYIGDEPRSNATNTLRIECDGYPPISFTFNRFSIQYGDYNPGSISVSYGLRGKDYPYKEANSLYKIYKY